MLRGLVEPVVDIWGSRTLCGRAAAFFKESIIRDIITGRYLKPDVSHWSKSPSEKLDVHGEATDHGGEKHNEGFVIRKDQ